MNKNILHALMNEDIITSMINSDDYTDIDDLFDKGVVTIPGSKKRILEILDSLNTEPVVDTVIEPVVDTVIEPVVDTVIEPVVDTVVNDEPEPEPVTETQIIVDEDVTTVKETKTTKKSKKAE